ncbi:cysteine synthase family protein [Halalkalibacter sp. AB-rgal2]|uniref:cysteine synthase family protein n=1 Tax=Halalkalibacter sp. AB-rgal2 TaxID=3242695 RepID=UPI00359DF240
MFPTILDTIGNTPIITIANLNQPDEGQVLFKYERFNPGGSIKDRSAIFMIEEAEKRGLLKPGGTVIESSSGNFGISLAMIGAAKGYRVIAIVDPKTTSSNLALLKSFGAEVIVVNEKDDCGSYHKTRILLANKLAKEIKDSYRPDQCFNLLNREAHYQNTAREMIEQCGGKLTTFITAVSTGGQLGGISKYLKSFLPEVQIIGVDAMGSIIFGGEPHSYRIPGVGLGWTPHNLNLQHIDCAYKIPDEQAFLTARAFARYEGILMGPSSGACALVALKVAQNLSAEGRVVCMISDGGDRYIQTLFNDEWMKEQGFSLQVDIGTIRLMAKQLQPLKVSVPDNDNMGLDLMKYLNVPTTTLQMNEELGQ